MQGSVFPFLRNFTFNSTLCTTCLSHYKEANEFYNKLDENSGHALCMDIVDSVSAQYD